VIFAGGVKRFVGRAFAGGIKGGGPAAHQLQQGTPAAGLPRVGTNHQQRRRSQPGHGRLLSGPGPAGRARSEPQAIRPLAALQHFPSGALLELAQPRAVRGIGWAGERDLILPVPRQPPGWCRSEAAWCADRRPASLARSAPAITPLQKQAPRNLASGF